VKKLPRGLYAVTDSTLTPAAHIVDAVARAIQGGAVMVQYRDKGHDFERRAWEAQDLLSMCRSLRVPLIINDDVELAAHIGADGVHLGTDDAVVTHARDLLGAEAIIGVSCYNELKRADHAVAIDADYVAFGSFFPSLTKPAAARATPELLREAKQRIKVPVVAIGGITPDNAPELVEAGADLLAVISGVFAASDIRAAAEQYAALYR
jgi:thiamine-phosphate pyrophosphorylase